MIPIDITYKSCSMQINILPNPGLIRTAILNSTLSMQIHEERVQRFVISYDIQGLSVDEVAAYVHDRMIMAGVMQEIFQPQALEAASGCCQGSVSYTPDPACDQKSSVITAEAVMAASNAIKLV